MGPNGEYLEARFASSNAIDIAQKARTALERWKRIQVDKGYSNKPVPAVETRLPEKELENNKLVFQVNLRDLPRTGSGRVTKFDDVGKIQEAWPDFRKWAFNENWYGTQNVEAFLTSSANFVAVDDDEFRTICTQVLVDNVRGQAPTWEDSAVKSSTLKKRRLPIANGKWIIEYQGSAEIRQGQNTYLPKVYGRGVWDPAKKSFESLSLVATGDRSGAWPFNNRADDRGPAPMGVTLVLYK